MPHTEKRWWTRAMEGLLDFELFVWMGRGLFALAFSWLDS